MFFSKKALFILLLMILALAAGGSWYVWREKGHDHSAEGKAAQGKQLYTCSMHPFIIKDKPGTCPICGMELIKSSGGAQPPGFGSAQPPQGQADMAEHVSLSPTQRVMANVATVAAKQTTLDKEINAVGIVQYDQSRQAKVTAWIAGRIDTLHVNKVGDIVDRDRPVAEVYSPDLLATQQEYLLALKSREQLKGSSLASISQSGEGLVSSAKQRLMLFGVKESQIVELEKAGKPNIRLPIYTPLAGVVIEKMVQEGQYVNSGEVLFAIADLNKVWVEIDVFESEVPYVRVGQQVEIRSSGDQHIAVHGKISFVYPFHDPKTHTVKARVELANTSRMLKPDMFVNAIIRVPLVTGIVIPVTAVIDTGKRQVVWVETAPGMFESRDVQVGERVEDKLQILSGLKAGDKVAVSGGYLIDSESQLQSGTKDQGQAKGGHEGHTTLASPPAKKKDLLKMDDMKM